MDDKDNVSLLNLPTGMSKVEAVVVSFNSVKFTQLEKLGLTVYPMMVVLKSLFAATIT